MPKCLIHILTSKHNTLHFQIKSCQFSSFLTFPLFLCFVANWYFNKQKSLLLTFWWIAQIVKCSDRVLLNGKAHSINSRCHVTTCIVVDNHFCVSLLSSEPYPFLPPSPLYCSQHFILRVIEFIYTFISSCWCPIFLCFVMLPVFYMFIFLLKESQGLAL